MNKLSICIVLALSILSFNNVSFGTETPNPGKDPIRSVAPDGSENDQSNGGPAAIPFGGADIEPEKTDTKTIRKNGIGLTGVIESLKDNSVRIKASKGQVRDFQFTEQTVTTSPQGSSDVILKKGDSVFVLYDETSKSLQSVQILK
jgi:hypothetical protein